jgi:hypothetical protein
VAPLAGRFGITFRVPYSSFAFDVADGEGGLREVRSSGLGNVYVGFIYGDGTGRLHSSSSIGVCLPTAEASDADAAGLAWLANPYDLDRFAPQLMSIRADYAVRWLFDSGAQCGLSLGHALVLPTGAGHEGRSEGWIRAGVAAGWNRAGFLLLAEYGALVSYTVPDPASHLFPALAAGLQYVGGPVRPKVFWVRQLDREMRRVVDHSIGVGIEFVP